MERMIQENAAQSRTSKYRRNLRRRGPNVCKWQYHLYDVFLEAQNLIMVIRTRKVNKYVYTYSFKSKCILFYFFMIVTYIIHLLYLFMGRLWGVQCCLCFLTRDSNGRICKYRCRDGMDRCIPRFRQNYLPDSLPVFCLIMTVLQIWKQVLEQ